MTDQPASDPSMDEILASIRRIIAEDPAPMGHGATPQAEPVHPTDPDEPTAAAEPVDSADVEQSLPPSPEPVKVTPVNDAHETSDDPLLSDDAAHATASAFDALAATAHEGAGARETIVLPAPGRTIEDLVADTLRPLLKSWLDENLPEIVRDRVDEEVRRIARSRVR